MNLGVYKPSKKNLKFFVEFRIEDLSAVPLVRGILFAKIRLLQGSDFTRMSTRKEVIDHVVTWKCRFEFECKLTSSILTGILDPCIARVSVRRESHGGLTFQKMGFADINLAEFAGCPQSRSFLLTEYKSNTSVPAYNALLKVTVAMKLLEGDILFKVPQPTVPPLFEPNLSSKPTTPTKEKDEWKESVPDLKTKVLYKRETSQCHRRQTSSTSDPGHRSCSPEEKATATVAENKEESPSASGEVTDTAHDEEIKKKVALAIAAIRDRRDVSDRIYASRVNPELVIDELFAQANLDMESPTNATENESVLMKLLDNNGATDQNLVNLALIESSYPQPIL